MIEKFGQFLRRAKEKLSYNKSIREMPKRAREPLIHLFVSEGSLFSAHITFSNMNTFENWVKTKFPGADNLELVKSMHVIVGDWVQVMKNEKGEIIIK